MNAVFEHAELGDGEGSRERSDERVRDEQAWLRMEDEGCPNGGQQPPPAGHYQDARFESGRMRLSAGREASSI